MASRSGPDVTVSWSPDSVCVLHDDTCSAVSPRASGVWHRAVPARGHAAPAHSLPGRAGGCPALAVTLAHSPPSRSFEGNLNTYKRLASKMPDSQITKVRDGAARPLVLPPPCLGAAARLASGTGGGRGPVRVCAVRWPCPCLAEWLQRGRRERGRAGRRDERRRALGRARRHLRRAQDVRHLRRLRGLRQRPGGAPRGAWRGDAPAGSVRGNGGAGAVLGGARWLLLRATCRGRLCLPAGAPPVNPVKTRQA